MLEAGEDPLFVLRRMVIFAAEDVGNADPQALSVAIAAHRRVPLHRPARGAAADDRRRCSISRPRPRRTPRSPPTRRPRPTSTRTARCRCPPHLRNAPTPLAEAAGLGRRLPVPARLRGPLRPRGVPARRAARPHATTSRRTRATKARSPRGSPSCAPPTPKGRRNSREEGGAVAPSYFAVAVTDAVAQSSLRNGAAGRSAWLRSVAARIVAPAVADGDRLRDLGARDDDGAALDARVGRLPDPIGAGDQEAPRRRAVGRRQAAGDVVKRTLIAAPSRIAAANVGPDAMTRGRRPASAPPARAAGRPPACCAGGCRAASPMSSVTAIAVRGSRSASACASRSSAQLPSPSAGFASVVLEVRELHEQKRQLRVAPRRAPGPDHRRKQRAVLRRARDVALALVPDDARRPAGPPSGATIAFHSTVGLAGSSVPSSLGRELQSATAGVSLRSIL